MPVQWDKLEPGRYEDMVAILLSRLYPDSLRIDGKGGDGGRDVQIVDRRDGSTVEAFELKSFTGRITWARRRQVERSLKTASVLKLPQWTLVVPIDPTPGELEWFDKLRDGYLFPLVWRGKTWLDEKMAAFPDIERYFVEGASDEVIRLVSQLRDEQAWIGDVNEGVRRFIALQERLNEIDPHYRYELATVHPESNFWPSDGALSVRHGDVRIDVYPKYSGATDDRPITLSFELALEPEGLVIHESLGYGLAVEIPDRLISNLKIDAPAGLGGDFAGSELSLLPLDTQMDEPITVALDVRDGGDLLASCSIRLTERTSGHKGVTLKGNDSTGWLEVTFRANIADEEFEMQYQLSPDRAMPAALVPLFKWLDAFQPGRQLQIRLPGGFELCSQVNKPILEDGSARSVVEALAYIQDGTNSYWEVSPLISAEDAQAVVETAALMRGEFVPFKWTSFSLNLKRWGSEFEELERGETVQFMFENDMSLELDEVVVPIGRIRTHIPSARLADAETVRRILASGSVPTLQLVPGDNDQAQRILVSELG